MSTAGFTGDVREARRPPSRLRARGPGRLVGLLLTSGGRDAGRALTAAGDGARPGDLPLAPLCGPEGLFIEVPTAPVARRAVALLQRAVGVRPGLAVRRGGGAGTVHRVGVPLDAVRRRDALPRGRPGPVEDGADPETLALLRGAVLGAAAVSAPGRPPHLELGPLDAAAAALIVAALDQAVGARARHDAARRRVVVKSGRAIADLLAVLGATRAFLAFDERLLRRQLRSDATRLANADAANAARSARRAGEEVAAIRGAVAAQGWDAFEPDLRDVALARLTNPEASLSELATLLGVPRATLHRRLRRVEDVAWRSAGDA